MLSSVYELKIHDIDHVRAFSTYRLINFLIDGLVSWLICYVLVQLLKNVSLDYTQLGIWERRFLNYTSYPLVMLCQELLLGGKSVGKMLTKTAVTKLDGTKPDSKDILLRSLCRLIPFEALSALGTPCNPWHDRLSNTVVVDEHRLALRMQSDEFTQLLKKD
jgi:uncharacterized RDD family membrane protein YckC